jgi:hypothetical protein
MKWRDFVLAVVVVVLVVVEGVWEDVVVLSTPGWAVVVVVVVVCWCWVLWVCVVVGWVGWLRWSWGCVVVCSVVFWLFWSLVCGCRVRPWFVFLVWVSSVVLEVFFFWFFLADFCHAVT